MRLRRKRSLPMPAAAPAEPEVIKKGKQETAEAGAEAAPEKAEKPEKGEKKEKK